jgi:hypothetical protein
LPRQLRSAKRVRTISELSGDGCVFKIGRLRQEYVSVMVGLGRHNLEIELTGERRRHYLTDHAEEAQHEDKLRDAILNPDEIHRNCTELYGAIF